MLDEMYFIGCRKATSLSGRAKLKPKSEPGPEPKPNVEPEHEPEPDITLYTAPATLLLIQPLFLFQKSTAPTLLDSIHMPESHANSFVTIGSVPFCQLPTSLAHNAQAPPLCKTGPDYSFTRSLRCKNASRLTAKCPWAHQRRWTD